jgi:ABC-2 type transport system permease protein
MTLAFIRAETVRLLLDVRFLALAVVTPIGFYLLFATLFGASGGPGELPGTVEIMVAMAAYGGIWAVLSATGPRIAQEREIGWLSTVQAMPVRAGQVLAAKLIAALVAALPALGLVCATAAVAKGVRLEAWQWLAILGAMWVGTLPFAVLGVAMGYAIGADASYVVSYAVYMVMSALGGLWVPPAVLPPSFRAVAGWLPTNRLAELGWMIAGGRAPGMVPVAVLAAWTVALAAIAALAYRWQRR